MKTKLVTIKDVYQYGVTLSDGLGASIENFPNVKVGQEWKVVEDDKDPNFPGVIFPLGVIISTTLIKDVP